jgi:hypothetical protein
MDDSKVTYVLGYYPTHNTWDNRFHNLKVQVTRKGLNVRHRLGYFAFGEKQLTEKERKDILQQALLSPLESTSVGLTIRLGPNVPSPGKLRVVMLVDAHNVALEQKDDRWTGRLDFLFLQQASADKAPTVAVQGIALNLKKETYEQALKTGFFVAKDLELGDSAYQIKVAVWDFGSGNVGTVNVLTQGLKEVPQSASKPPAPVKP